MQLRLATQPLPAQPCLPSRPTLSDATHCRLPSTCLTSALETERPSREAPQRRRAAGPERQRPASPLCTEAGGHDAGTPAWEPQKAAVPASGASAWTCSRCRAPPHTPAQGLRHGRILTPKVKSPGGWGSYIIRGRLYTPSYPLEKATYVPSTILSKKTAALVSDTLGNTGQWGARGFQMHLI